MALSASKAFVVKTGECVWWQHGYTEKLEARRTRAPQSSLGAYPQRLATRLHLQTQDHKVTLEDQAVSLWPSRDKARSQTRQGVRGEQLKATRVGVGSVQTPGSAPILEAQ